MNVLQKIISSILFWKKKDKIIESSAPVALSISQSSAEEKKRLREEAISKVLKKNEEDEKYAEYVTKNIGLEFEEPSILARVYAEQISTIRKMVGVKSGERSEYFEKFYLAPILKFFEIVQLLPASEYDHHRDVGGLIIHSLEVSIYALSISKGFYLPPIGTSDIEFERKKRWAYAAWLAALFHDVGKPMTMINVYNEKGYRWDSYVETMIEWRDRTNSQRYLLTWNSERRQEDHNTVAVSWFFRATNSEILSYLQSGEDGLVEEISYSLSNLTRKENYLSDIVRRADAISVKKYYENSVTKLLGEKRQSIESTFIDSLRHMVKNVWEHETFNTPKGELWVIKDDVYITADRAVTDVSAEMRRRGINLPLAREKILKILSERRIIQTLDGFSPFLFKPSSYNDLISLVRIPSPTLAFSDSVIPTSIPGKFKVTYAEELESKRQDSIKKKAEELERVLFNDNDAFNDNKYTSSDFEIEPTIVQKNTNSEQRFEIEQETTPVIKKKIKSSASEKKEFVNEETTKDKKSIHEEKETDKKGSISQRYLQRKGATSIKENKSPFEKSVKNVSGKSKSKEPFNNDTSSKNTTVNHEQKGFEFLENVPSQESKHSQEDKETKNKFEQSSIKISREAPLETDAIPAENKVVPSPEQINFMKAKKNSKNTHIKTWVFSEYLFKNADEAWLFLESNYPKSKGIIEKIIKLIETGDINNFTHSDAPFYLSHSVANHPLFGYQVKKLSEKMKSISFSSAHKVLEKENALAINYSSMMKDSKNKSDKFVFNSTTQKKEEPRYFFNGNISSAIAKILNLNNLSNHGDKIVTKETDKNDISDKNTLDNQNKLQSSNSAQSKIIYSLPSAENIYMVNEAELFIWAKNFGNNDILISGLISEAFSKLNISSRFNEKTLAYLWKKNLLLSKRFVRAYFHHRDIPSDKAEEIISLISVELDDELKKSNLHEVFYKVRLPSSIIKEL